MEEEVLPHNNSEDYKADSNEILANKTSNLIVDDGDDFLDNCPPDFSLAWKHSDAHKVKNLEHFGVANKNIEDDNKFCPCCRFPTTKAVPKYSLCSSTVKLKYLGSCFSLYYQLKIFLSIIYIIMFIVVGIAGVIINLYQDKGSEWVGESTPSYPTKMSIGNFGKDPDNYKLGGILAESILNLIFIFVILFGSIILRRIQNKITNDADETNLTPSDYCVMITNLPKDKTQEETKEYLEKVSPGIEIVYINYCYKIKEIVDISRKLMNFQNMKSYIQSYRKNRLKRLGMDESEAEAKGINLHPPPSKLLCCYKKEYPQEEQLEDDIDKTQKELDEIKKYMNVNTELDLYCGTAFVVCNKQSHIYNLIKKFYVPLYKQFINFIFYRMCRCKNLKLDSRYWEGRRIYVERASEPSDVYWENLSINTIQRVKKMSVTYIITFLCLCVAFGINLGLNILKNSYSSSNKSTSSSATTSIRAIAICTSIIVVMINVALGRIVRILSAYENHETYSKYHLSVEIKLATVMFINTGILPMFVNWGKSNWYDSGGLMDSIFYNTISVCFVSPIFYYLNPTFIIKRIKIFVEICRGEKSKMTQRQANELFMGPSVDMAQRYANTALLLLLTVFYSFPLPIISVLAFFGTVFQYWLEKYLLLRRHRIPEQMGSTMARTFSNSIVYICFVYGLSLFVFTNIMSDGKNIVGLIAFIFCIWFILVPVRIIIAKCTSEVFRRDEMTYERHSITFLTDYDRANPMTTREAHIKYYEKLRDSGEIDSEKFESQKKMISNAGRFGGVVDYGQATNSLQTRAQFTFQNPIINFGNQPYQSRYLGFHQMNAVPHNYFLRAFIPASQMNIGGYSPIITNGPTYQWPVFIPRAPIMNINAVQQATQVVHTAYNTTQQIQPTYVAPARVNLAPTYNQPQVVYNQPVYNQQPRYGIL